MGITIIRNSDSATVMYELSECRKAHPNVYIKLNCFNNARCVESTALSFIANRPSFEPGFYLVRQEGRGRNIVLSKVTLFNLLLRVHVN
jgi:ribulose-bisphosphate carboxylase small chain